MAKLGSKKRPIILRATTQASALEATAICDRFGWHYIVGIEPGKPEDFRDLNRALDAAGALNPREGMMQLMEIAPHLAETETRSIVLERGRPGLPADTYCFDESYCTEVGCDCRRVLVAVISATKQEQVATINYSFDSANLDEDDPERLFLDPLNPQSERSYMLLALFEEMLEDDAYRERLERHYEAVKSIASEPASTRRIRAPDGGAVAPLRSRRSKTPTPSSSNRERVFVFDREMTRLVAEVEPARWDRAISQAGGQVAKAAAALGLEGAAAGARILRGQDAEAAMRELRAAGRRRR